MESPTTTIPLASVNFHLVKQKVGLDIDLLKKEVKGYVEIDLSPLQREHRHIRIHARQLQIHQVTVNGHAANYLLYDYQNEVPLQHTNNVLEQGSIHDHAEFARMLEAMAEQASEGELDIAIPEAVQAIPIVEEGQVPTTAAAAAAATETGAKGDALWSPQTALPLPSPMTPMTPGSYLLQRKPQFQAFRLRIEYSLSNIEAGLLFHSPEPAAAPYDYPYMYSTNYSISNRLWLPCIDMQSARCPFEIELVCQRYIRMADPAQRGFVRETQLICSGDLQQTDVDEYRKRVVYTSDAMSAADLIVAAGPWECIQVPMLSDERHPYTQYPPTVFAFCLPDMAADLDITLGIDSHALSKIFGKCSELIRQSFPFNQYKLLFVDELAQPMLSGQAVTLMSTDILHDGTLLEEAIASRKQMTLAVTAQWFGQWFYPHDLSDTWLVTGLCNYIAAQYMRSLYGKNELTAKAKDIERVCFLDKSQPPLTEMYTANCQDDALQNELLQLKSPLIIHLLERQIAKANFQKVLVTLCDPSKRDYKRGLRTSDFLRLVKKTASKELRSFAEQWIYGSGCPEFTCTFHFNKKKNVVELYTKQTQEQKAPQLDRKEKVKYTGPLTVRVIEPDRPYDHILHIDDLEQKHELTYNANFRKLRTTRRLRNDKARQVEEVLARERAAGLRKQLIINDAIRAELNRANPLAIDHDALAAMDEDEPSGITAAATTAGPSTSGNHANPIEWIRIDPEMDWLATFKFHQDQSMWIEALSNDIDVHAQYQAIGALAQQPSVASSVPILRILIDPYLHHAIRAKAANALATFSALTIESVGVRQLLMVYQHKFCYPFSATTAPGVDPVAQQFTPLPLVYKDSQDYLLHIALIQALSTVRTSNLELMHALREILLLQLSAAELSPPSTTTTTQHQQSQTPSFAPTYVIATLLRAVGVALLPQPGETIAKAVMTRAQEDVERWLHRDAMLLSHHNDITVACLEATGQWMLADLIDADVEHFLTYSAIGNDEHVRVEAFRNLVLLGLNSNMIGKYLLYTLHHDPSKRIQRELLFTFRDLARIYYHAAVQEEYPEPSSSSSSLPASPGLALFGGGIGGGATSSSSGNEISMVPLRPKLHLHAKHGGRHGGRDAGLTWRSFAKRKEVTDLFWHLLVIGWAYDTPMRLALLELCRYTYESKDPGRVDFVPQDEVLGSPPGASGTGGAPATGSVTLTSARGSGPSSAGPTLKLTVAATSTSATSATSGAMSGKGAAQITAKCRQVVRALQEHPQAIWFLEPVQPHLAPGYYEQIRDPMDLETISTRLKRNKYRDIDEFKEDIALIFRNCFAFNPPTTEPHIAGQMLKKYYESRSVQKHLK